MADAQTPESEVLGGPMALGTLSANSALVLRLPVVWLSLRGRKASHFAPAEIRFMRPWTKKLLYVRTQDERRK